MRREIGAALLGRRAVPLDETHARIAIAEHVAPLLTGAPSLFGDRTAAALVADAARIDAIRCAMFDDEVRRLYAHLATRDLAPLVIKGAHLAHAVYGNPLRRPRSDTDLLFAPPGRERIEAALIEAGYARSIHTRGALILGQYHFERRDRTGVVHHLDVHWRAASPLLVERVLPARALIASAERLPTLGDTARAPSLEDALALACVHVVAHHWPGIELRWAYDLHLLARELGDEGVARFAVTARQRGYRMVCAHALSSAADLLEDDTLRRLSRSLERGAGDEPSAALLQGRSLAASLWLDLRVAGWRDRLRLLREHLVPDRAYMKATAAGRPLPLAYILRAVKGVRRWLSAWDRTAE